MELVAKQIDLISHEEWQRLLTPQPGLCVSLYMPTEQKGRATQQQPIRLKNLLAQAAEQLDQQGRRADEVEQLLAPAYQLVEFNPFWQIQSAGLALFLTPEWFVYYRSPLQFAELVVVNERCHIKPLLPLISEAGLFYVLTLNQQGVRLYQGSRFQLTAVEVDPAVPHSLADELRYDEFEAQLQFHTGTGRTTNTGRRGAMFFGQGDAGDEALLKEQLLRFFQHLDDGVRRTINEGKRTPLVLAGIEYLQGLYRQANQYHQLVEQGIEKDPETLNPEELHQAAWASVEPLFQQARQQALDHYHHLAGTGDSRAAHELATIVAAAYFQRVDTLFITPAQAVWGSFSPARNMAEVHPEHQAGDEDLLDLAASSTLLNGGRVYAVAADELPAAGPAAAIFRY